MDFVRLGKSVFPLLCVMVFWAFQGFAGDAAGKPGRGEPGIVEIECNISNVELRLCPQEKYEKKEKDVLFGLIKSEKRFCSEGEISLGGTPVNPLSVPPGQYILLTPQGFHAKHDGPIEINVESGKRTFFVLKLFSTRADGSGEDHGAGGGAGAGGAPGR